VSVRRGAGRHRARVAVGEHHEGAGVRAKHQVLVYVHRSKYAACQAVASEPAFPRPVSANPGPPIETGVARSVGARGRSD
jgi:hypothetical protein